MRLSSGTLRFLLIAWLVAGCDADLREPAIEHLVPAEGAPGQIIDVLGRGFGSVAGFVSFSGIAADNESWERTRIHVVVPTGLPEGSEVLVVVTANGTPSVPVPFLITY